MEHYRSYRPAPALRPYIDCIWEEDYFDQPIHQNIPQLIVPDNSIELIFSLETIRRKDIGGKEIHVRGSHISGFKTRHQRITLKQSPLLSVRFNAYGLSRFARTPPKETIDQTVLPEDILGASVLELEGRLFEASGIQERLQLINAYFQERLQVNRSHRELLFEAIHRKLTAAKGMLKVQALADAFSVSGKTLERLFVGQTGLSPKKYSRLFRFFCAMKEKNSKSGMSLTELAHKYGFFDQMHFIKEVRKVTGMAPRDYLRRGKGIQQPIFSESAG